jgi:16S rRNA A1518/A1519 N6-dimethyltransferase RsmA/KsgA/DIM1 with predicted DNA glycosylase/AP lyase activity
MPINQWNASLYDQKHSFVFEYGKELVKLLDPKPGERILDLGSGTGHLTKEIFQTVGDLEVVGYHIVLTLFFQMQFFTGYLKLKWRRQIYLRH